jgi:endonuclease/exonuclease/phosphatase (EEP) superfamily protein YafD
LRTIPLIAIGLYGLALLLFFIVRWLVGETTPIAQINLVLVPLMLPALILLPVCLLIRRPRLALLFAPTLLLFGLDYGPLFIPPASTPNPDMPRLTLATFNLAAHDDNLTPLIDVIAALDTDVIALQELSREMGALIDTQLAQDYPYRMLHTADSGYFGYGILSRWPIVDDFSYPREPDRLRLQRAVLDFDGQPITLFNFHAQPINESWRPPDVWVRRNQVLFLIDEATTMDGPRLLMGDFNLTKPSEDYQHIAAHFADTFYEVGFGLGFTGPDWLGFENTGLSPDLLQYLPAYQRIDFIFHDGYFESVSASVYPTRGESDHRPVYATLALNRER